MQRRIIFIIILSILALLAGLGVVSYLNITVSVNTTLDNHLTEANIIARQVDQVLEANITKLYDISLAGSVNFDGDWEPEERALRVAYEYSIFSEGIFIFDRDEKHIVTYPYRAVGKESLPSGDLLKRVLVEGKPVVSNVVTLRQSGRKAIFVLVPMRDGKGEVFGAAGGEISPAASSFSKIIRSINERKEAAVELVDGDGVIIASSDLQRVLTGSDHNRFFAGLIAEKKSSVGTCHRCHESGGDEASRTVDMVAFAPLTYAPWGVSVREPRERIMAPVTRLEKSFLVLGLLSVLTALFLAVGLSRSIVKPVQALIRATRRIAEGDLDRPVIVQSGDEIGTLSRSFDHMRIRLAESLDRIRSHNVELEQRVAKRTGELESSRRKLADLLVSVLNAQEEERLRVARELHDDTSQSLNAVLMSLDSLSMSLRGHEDVRARITRLREQCMAALGGVHRLIKDLRPPVLDDLGLESAVRWVMDRHLSEKGVAFSLDSRGDRSEALESFDADRRNVELVLFRVIQEAVINISKHAAAGKVSVTMRFKPSGIRVIIEDDGKGFDADRLLEDARSGKGRSFGLLGMQERIALLDGKLEVKSDPGKGTTITIEIAPPKTREGQRKGKDHEQDTYSHSR